MTGGMDSRLQKEGDTTMKPMDYELLARYGQITFTHPEQAVYSVPASDLSNPGAALLLANRFLDHMDCDDIVTAGVYCAGYMRGLVMAQHYMVSVMNRTVNLAPSNLVIHVKYADGYPSLQFQPLDDMESGPEHPELRDSWADEQFNTFFSDTIRPILENLAEAVSAPIGQLWGQMPLGLLYFRDQVLPMLETEGERDTLERDYGYVTHTMEGALFGRTRNPFSIRFVELDNPHNPGTTMYMKPSCCQYYKTGEGEYCYSCPKLTRAQREQRRQEIMLQSG